MPSSEKSTPRDAAVHANQHSRPSTTTRNAAGAHRTKARVRGDMSGNLSDEANRRSGGCRILTSMRQPRRGVSSSLASSRTRWSLATFFSLLVLLLTWAFAPPRSGAPDELSHTIKAYGTAHGQLRGSTTPGQSTLIRMYEVPKGLASGEPWCFASLPEANAGCSVAIRDDTTVAAESSAATYPVPFYAVV